jgi:3-hydroxyisobutyrate dehydrogenase-like beta-hydroxyacid dehydrogenase
MLEKRVKAEGLAFLPLAQAIAGADLVLSTVTTDVTEAAARSCAQHLKTGQVYIDLNATTPAVKLSISRIILVTDAAFVEGAILGAVGVTGPKTRILTGGGNRNSSRRYPQPFRSQCSCL